MTVPTLPCYVAGEPCEPNLDLEVRDKYTGEVFQRVPWAGREPVESAIAAAVQAAPAMRRMPAYQRRDVLLHCVQRFQDRADELALSLCREAGKPLQHARKEVGRLVDTFRVAAGEATRITGEVLPLDISPASKDYRGFWKRVPVGPCGFVTPFNFPLNLVAHKVAPAIAAGCPFVLRPARATPVGALIIGSILAETDLPAGAFSVLPCPHSAADLLVEDDRIRHLSFTGSPQVGWELKARAARKSVTLELGGNAAVLVDEDLRGDEDRIRDALDRILLGAFYQSGQSCISVQRILVHASLYEDFVPRLVEGAQALVAGDPREEETFVGPLISDAEADRVESWIAAAVDRGARVLCGNRREGNIIRPTLLADVPRGCDVREGEVFGPVAVVEPFTDFQAALCEVNDSIYGLQAGVFTRDLYRALDAWDELDVGGVIVGDIPSWRVDHMPYGGVKNSGEGREGIRWAIESMTEVRLLAIRRTVPEPEIG